jgi:hypothetical protein
MTRSTSLPLRRSVVNEKLACLSVLGFSSRSIRSSALRRLLGAPCRRSPYDVPLNEILHPGNFLALLLVQLQLLGERRGLQIHEPAVVARVSRRLVPLDLDDGRHRRIEKIAVVRDDDHRAGIGP